MIGYSTACGGRNESRHAQRRAGGIATGRSVVNTRGFAQALGINAPCICQQGGIIHDYATETNLFSLKLRRELACELVHLASSTQLAHHRLSGRPYLHYRQAYAKSFYGPGRHR